MTKQLNVTIEKVILTGKSLKDLNPEQLLSLWENSKKDLPQETYQLIINEVNRRLVGE